VVKALTQLALEVGTLIAVIKMVIESINWKKGRETSPPKRYHSLSAKSTW